MLFLWMAFSVDDENQYMNLYSFFFDGKTAVNRTTQTTNNNKRIETKRPTAAIPTAATQRRPTVPCWRARCEKRGQAQGHIIVEWWRRIKRLENGPQKLLRLYKSIMDYVFAVLAKFYVFGIWVATMQTGMKRRNIGGRMKGKKRHRKCVQLKIISDRFCLLQMRRHVKIVIANPALVVACIALAVYRARLATHLDVYSSIALHFLRFSHRIYSSAKFVAFPGHCIVFASMLLSRSQRTPT